MPRPVSTIVLALCLSLVHGAPCAEPTAVPPDPLPTVQEVLDRFVAAVGGREAVAALAVRRYRGVVVQDLTWTEPQHQETPFVAETDSADGLRWADSRAWSDLSTEAGAQQRSKLRWLLHPHNALLVEEFFPGLSVAGRETRDGRAVIVLAPRELDYAYHALYFDEVTGLLSHVGYHDDLQDWRPGGGVLFPHRWVFGRKGGHTTYVFDEVAAEPAPGRP